MSDPGAGKNQADASSSLLPEGLPSFEEVTRSMQVFIIHQLLCHNHHNAKSYAKESYRLQDLAEREVEAWPSPTVPQPVCPTTVVPQPLYPSTTVVPQPVCPSTLLPQPVCPSALVPQPVYPPTVPQSVCPSSLVPQPVCPPTVPQPGPPTVSQPGGQVVLPILEGCCGN